MLTGSADSVNRNSARVSSSSMIIDRPVLDYHGVTLTESDLQSLEHETGWLTDNIISFSFNFFEHEHFQDCKEFEFIVPSVVQLLKLCPLDDLKDILKTMKLHERTKRFVFFALNNHDDHIGGGGSHWSLLVLDTKDCVLHSYDSLEGVNYEFAEEFLRRLQKAIYGSRLQISARKCPQQQNTSDCGMFVILVTKAICKHFIKHCKHQNPDDFSLDILDDLISESIDADPVENGRGRLYEIIVNHVGQQQQQQQK